MIGKMQHLMTFENYGFNATIDPDHDEKIKSNIHILYVYCSLPGALKGSVRGQDGSNIIDIDQSFIDKEIMHSWNDVTGLREYLIKRKKIKPTDIINIDGCLTADTTLTIIPHEQINIPIV